MNRYLLVTLISLLILAVALPLYGWLEPDRMENAQADLRQQFVSDAALLYVENCAVCHGASGEGIGATPTLASEGIRTADYDFLFKTIARGRYNTAMTGWSEEEGGIFNDYEIQELVAFLRYVDWDQVSEIAAQQGLIPPTLPVPDVNDDFLAQVAALTPEGETWARGINLYAQNCTTCHGVNGEGSSLAPALNTDELRAMSGDDLTRTIRDGVPNTMMASWDGQLSAEEITDIVSFLQNWDKINEAGLQLTPPVPIHIDINNPEEMLALGEQLYNTTCTVCHGDNGSGGTGPVLNSQQILSRKSDEDIRNTIIYGPHRPGSIMPAFGDRLTSVEVDAIVQYVRAWEPTAPWVENPRGSAQGGGPPWLRATPDAENPIVPGQTRGRGPRWARDQESSTEPVVAEQGPTLSFQGTVISVEDNLLTFSDEAGNQHQAMLGPPWFWSENGIELNTGDPIALEGFESPDHMEINWIKNERTGQRLELRTADGTPVWGSQ